MIHKVLKGDRPERSKDAAAINFSDSLWHIAEDCWKQQRTERTNVRAVIDGLNKITGYWVAPLPMAKNLDGGDESDGSSGSFTSSEFNSAPITRKHFTSIYRSGTHGCKHYES